MIKKQQHNWSRKKSLLKLGRTLILTCVVELSLIFAIAAGKTVPITPSCSVNSVINGKLTVTATGSLNSDLNAIDSENTTSPQASVSLAEAEATVENGTQVILNLSATTTKGYSETTGGCMGIGGTTTVYQAASTKLDVTFTNNTDEFIQVSSVVPGTANTTVSTATPITLSKGQSFTITLWANRTADQMDNALTVNDTVTIVGKVLSQSTLTLDAGASNGYTVTAGSSPVSVAAGKILEQPVSAGSTVTLPTLTDSANYIFYGWRLNDGQLLENGASFMIGGDTSLTPIYLPTNAYGTDTNGKIQRKNEAGSFVERPFSVGTESYLFWADAFAAAKSTGGTVVLATDYTLPSTLVDNGVGVLGCNYLSGTDGNLTYHIPTSLKLLVPYAADDSGDFDLLPVTMGDEDADVPGGTYGPAANGGTQAVFRNLTVGTNTIIKCAGELNVNSMIFIDTAYSGCPGGTYGQITLSDPTAEIVVTRGGKLYCYGYIIGKVTDGEYAGGRVTVQDGGTLYESFFGLGYRGGTAMSKWASNAGVTKNNYDSAKTKSFAFTEYAIQNVEAEVLIQHGGTATAVSSTNIARMVVPYIVKDDGLDSQSGLLQMYAGSTVLRTYNPAKDRMTYRITGTADLGKLILDLGDAGLTMDSSNHIFGLNRSMEFVAADSRDADNPTQVNLLYAYKIMPGARFTVEENATATVKGKLFIFDVQDYIRKITYGNNTLGHAYHQSTHWQVNAITVPYIATPVNGKHAWSNFYSKKWVGDCWGNTDPVNENSPSGQLTVDGTLVVTSGAGVFTTVSGNSKTSGNNNIGNTPVASNSTDKVVKGAGEIQINSGALTTAYMDEIVHYYASMNGSWASGIETQVEPIYANLAGKTGMQPMNNSTYHGLGENYDNSWYQYEVSVTDEATNIAPSATAPTVGKTATTKDKVIGYAVSGGEFAFTVPAGYVATDNAVNGTYQGNGKLTVTKDTVLSYTPIAKIFTNKVASAPYYSIADAITAYGTPNSNKYIQMQTDYNASTGTFADGTYLDVNGFDITGVTATNLHGMDGRTDGYDATYAGSVSLATGITPSSVTSIDGKDYVSVQDDTATNKWSFHRVEIAPTAYQFYFNEKAHSHLTVQATFRGDSIVSNHLSDLGFQIMQSSQNHTYDSNVYGSGQAYWYGSAPELKDKDTIAYVALDYDGTTGFDDPFSVYALMKFGANEIDSPTNPSISFRQALEYFLADESNMSTDAWNTINLFLNPTTKGGT